MSRYFSGRLAALDPYVPGEQPTDRSYIKLNTNESPYPPSPRAVTAAAEAAKTLQLYPDPAAGKLRAALADTLGVDPDEVIVTNGSDEVLYFAFLAFCDAARGAVFADITYGFYPVFAALCTVPCRVVPLREDFSLSPDDYKNAGGTVFIANPNAPTGLALSRDEVEQILIANPDNVVVIDEAYVDFGAESCVPLIGKYGNLLVTQTFSKSRSMAGARLGFGVGQKALIRDLETVRNSTNPYNINRMTMAAGIGALADEDYTRANCRAVMQTRERTAAKLREMGFTVLPSSTNFLFAAHPRVGGLELYLALKARGVLVRHFEKPRLSPYNRITVGSPAEMEALTDTIKTILEELK